MAILSCTIALAAALGTQSAPGPPGAHGTERAWRVDASIAALQETWDVNDSTESLAGVVLGADRRVWRGLAIRGELLALRVLQQPDDAWLRGFTVGTRVRWGTASVRPVANIAVGLSSATRPVPQRGTTFNYLAVIGAGAEVPLRSFIISVTGRWFHASNNGREGRHRNPDIQALGAVVGVGWEY